MPLQCKGMESISSTRTSSSATSTTISGAALFARASIAVCTNTTTTTISPWPVHFLGQSRFSSYGSRGGTRTRASSVWGWQEIHFLTLRKRQRPLLRGASILRWHTSTVHSERTLYYIFVECQGKSLASLTFFSSA